MEARELTQTCQRFGHRPVQLVLVRANGPLFYTVAAASLLEALAPVYGERVRHYFATDRVLTHWLAHEWLPAKAARAAALREYVQRTWPEFDWTSAFEQCRAALVAEGGSGPLKPTPTQEAISRCVAAAQAGVVYRTLARWADDPALRALALEMAHGEACAFNQFRAAFERRARLQRFGVLATWRAVWDCMRAGRDRQLALVFGLIKAQCGPQVPFPVLEYPELLCRMRAVIERHAHLGTAERLLFHPWKGRPRHICASAPRSPAKPVTPFRPVLQTA